MQTASSAPPAARWRLAAESPATALPAEGASGCERSCDGAARTALYRELVALFAAAPLESVRGATTLSNGLSAAAFCLQELRAQSRGAPGVVCTRLDEWLPELQLHQPLSAGAKRARLYRRNHGQGRARSALLPHHSLHETRRMLLLVRNTQNLQLDERFPNGANIGDFITQYVCAGHFARLRQDAQRRERRRRRTEQTK